MYSVALPSAMRGPQAAWSPNFGAPIRPVACFCRPPKAAAGPSLGVARETLAACGGASIFSAESARAGHGNAHERLDPFA